MELRVSLCCPNCGSHDISIPEDPTDDAVISCSCGHKLGTCADLITAIAAKAQEQGIDKEIAERLKAEFGEVFEGMDGFEFD